MCEYFFYKQTKDKLIKIYINMYVYVYVYRVIYSIYIYKSHAKSVNIIHILFAFCTFYSFLFYFFLQKILTTTLTMTTAPSVYAYTYHHYICKSFTQTLFYSSPAATTITIVIITIKRKETF